MSKDECAGSKTPSILVIGQAYPRIKDIRPFGRTWLYKWFKEAGITEEEILNQFSFTALVTYFPGARGRSHLAPTRFQIAQEHSKLLQEIRRVNPDIIVTAGILSAREVLNMPPAMLDEIIGEKFYLDPFNALGRTITIIPLPHPSGASAWVYQDEHRALLKKALRLISREIKQK